MLLFLPFLEWNGNAKQSTTHKGPLGSHSPDLWEKPQWAQATAEQHFYGNTVKVKYPAEEKKSLSSRRLFKESSIFFFDYTSLWLDTPCVRGQRQSSNSWKMTAEHRGKRSGWVEVDNVILIPMNAMKPRSPLPLRKVHWNTPVKGSQHVLRQYQHPFPFPRSFPATNNSI